MSTDEKAPVTEQFAGAYYCVVHSGIQNEDDPNPQCDFAPCRRVRRR